MTGSISLIWAGTRMPCRNIGGNALLYHGLLDLFICLWLTRLQGKCRESHDKAENEVKTAH
jgi:hypothetical protein